MSEAKSNSPAAMSSRSRCEVAHFDMMFEIIQHKSTLHPIVVLQPAHLKRVAGPEATPYARQLASWPRLIIDMHTIAYKIVAGTAKIYQ